MREIAISKFKATCLAVLDDVRRTGAPIRVTRFGQPIADVVPPRQATQPSWLGCMRESFEAPGKSAGTSARSANGPLDENESVTRHSHLDLGSPESRENEPSLAAQGAGSNQTEFLAMARCGRCFKDRASSVGSRRHFSGRDRRHFGSDAGYVRFAASGL